MVGGGEYDIIFFGSQFAPSVELEPILAHMYNENTVFANYDLIRGINVIRSTYLPILKIKFAIKASPHLYDHPYNRQYLRNAEDSIITYAEWCGLSRRDIPSGHAIRYELQHATETASELLIEAEEELTGEDYSPEDYESFEISDLLNYNGVDFSGLYSV